MATNPADYRANQRMASGQSKEEAIKATRKLNKESKLLQKEEQDSPKRAKENEQQSPVVRKQSRKVWHSH